MLLIRCDIYVFKLRHVAKSLVYFPLSSGPKTLAIEATFRVIFSGKRANVSLASICVFGASNSLGEIL